MPAPIVRRATPVARDTNEMPPYPCATASLATKSRRARSFKDSRTCAYRCAICFAADVCHILRVGSSGDHNAMFILRRTLTDCRLPTAYC